MADARGTGVGVTGCWPYVGPLALSEQNVIYGRSRELRELYSLLIAERITLLHSPSGAGKSSLIQAGLIPRLRGRQMGQPNQDQEAPTPRRPHFEVVNIARFGAALPAEYLTVSHKANPFVLRLLASLEQARGQEVIAPAELAGLTLPAYVEMRYGERKALSSEELETAQPRARTNRDAPAGVVWIFDQFEDVLTVEPLDVDAKFDFFEQLGFVLGNRKRWVLFSMREDFLGQLDPYRDLLPGHLSATYRLAQLGPIAAAQAIHGPAKAAGIPFTEDAVNRLVKDLGTVVIPSPEGGRQSGQGLIEPVQLQVVCCRIWNHKPVGAQQISEDMVSDGDYVSHALTEYYSESVTEVFSKYKVHERRIRDWFERLITPQGTRGQVPLELEGEQALPRAALDALVDTHLIRRDDRYGTSWFELAHDRMIEPVRRNNKRWREKYLSTLQKRAPEWADTGRPQGLLLIGAELREAEQQARDAREEPAGLRKVEREFLDASLKAADARRRRLLSMVALFAILFTALVVVLFFWDQTRKAETTAVAESTRATIEANLANSRALALGALGRLQDRLDLSLLLSVESRTFSDTVEARSSLYSGLTQSPYLASFLWGEPRWAYAIAFSPDGTIVASAGDDGAIWLWDTQTHRLLRSLTGHGELPVTGLAFSPDGGILASGGWDRKVRLWEPGSGRQLAELEKRHTDDVTAVVFAPGGKTLVSTGREGTIWLWDPVAQVPLGVLPGGHVGAALAVAFSPRTNGSVVFSVGSDGLVRRWDLDTRREITPPLSARGRGVNNPLRAVAFSLQGDRVVAAGDDGIVLMWDVDASGRDVGTSGREPKIVPGSEGMINALAFNPNGQILFWAGGQHTVHAWGVGNQQEYTLTGHTGIVHALAISPDGRTLASAGEGREAGGATPLLADVRLWDVGLSWPTTATLPAPVGVVTSTSMTRDGSILAAGGADGLIRLWDLPAGSPHGEPLRGHQAGVSELAFSLLDGTLVSVGIDGELLLWSQPWEKPRVLTSGAGNVNKFRPRLAFSADGHTLAVARGSQVAVWDTNDTAGPKSTLDAQAQISALRFSADGRVLAAGGCSAPTPSGCPSGVLRLWEMPDGRLLASLPSDLPTELAAVAFSTDGHTLATGYTDSSIRLWNWPTLSALGPALQGHQGPVTGLAFSPDNLTLASTSKDGTVHLWPARGGVSPVVPLWRQVGAENDLAFSPDGRLLAAAGGGEPALRLFDVDPNSWVRRACAIANRNLSALEWEQYLPRGLPRRATCSNLPLDGP
ncbi:MAG TPA: hypothetical protein VJ183_15210 [Chloroflexia bacterium]|nr:hypothetical protein [Chloroflexia bacterium]